MSFEKSAGDYASFPEVLPTMQDIRFMSANIIDANGVLWEGDVPTFNVSWVQDDKNLRFLLQRRKPDPQVRLYRYDLHVRDQISDELIERFMYNTSKNDIDIFGNTHMITGQRTEQQRMMDLAAHLKTAPAGRTDKDEDFNQIIRISEFTEDEMYPRRLRRRARRILGIAARS